MYEAIVLLPLLGAVIAGVVCLVGARNRFPGEDPPPSAGHHDARLASEDHPRAAPAPHGGHDAIAHTDVEALEHPPSAAGSSLAELTTST
ncbi:MAG TPA: NADH-quinone oxidoreductase subunit L, partial [Xanthobacteraceae bacterium]